MLIEFEGLFLDEGFIMNEVALLHLLGVFPPDAVEEVVRIPQSVF